MMNKSNSTSSSEDDWTVVADHNTSTRRSATPFSMIDETNLPRGSMGTDEIISNLIVENRELTEEWHRRKIENEWMAREIKGARVLMSKMLETLSLDHNQEFKAVKSSNVREDLMCFRDLTKKLLYAVEGGMVRKVEHTAVKNMMKADHGDGLKLLHNPNSASECGDQKQISVELTRDEANVRDEDGNVKRARLPRIEELIEMQPDVRPRKTRRMVKEYNMKMRNVVKPAVMHHEHGTSRKKRWGQNCGASRQAFTARRNC